tara:strand:- start:10226 stop:10345 length:120 start_codon:yes stop_codon:yes gene_type:complete
MPFWKIDCDFGKAELSSAFHGLNPLGGFPAETAQFGFPY